MADTTVNTELEHAGLIEDTDVTGSAGYFKIDHITRSVTSDCKKISLMQYDHNSERFTFSVAKEIEGHDMTNCTIRIHYCNAGSNRSKHNGLYEVSDVAVNPDNEDEITFSWLISQNATQYAGSLSFLVEFTCVKTVEAPEEESGTRVEVWYRWSSNINKQISIVSGMNNNDSVDERYTDIINEWYTMIKKHLEDCDDRLQAGVQEIIEYVPTGENEVSLKTVTELNQNKKISFWIGTKEEYDALSEYDNENVFYIIKDSIDNLDSRVTTANDNIAALREDLTATEDNLDYIHEYLDIHASGGADLKSRVTTAENEIDNLENNVDTAIEHITNLENDLIATETETVKTKETTVFSLMDNSILGTTISDILKIKIDTTVNPILGSDGFRMSFNSYEITEENGQLKFEALVLYDGSKWKTSNIDMFKANIAGTTIVGFNNGSWNNWLLYGTEVEEVEGERGYLKKPDGTYFFPKTYDWTTTVSKDEISIPLDITGNISFLESSEIPNGKTVDDIVSISFDFKGHTINVNKCPGNVFHFLKMMMVDVEEGNGVVFYDVTFTLARLSDNSIAGKAHTTFCSIPCYEGETPGIIEFDYLTENLTNVTFYFK